jgi:hypothetical protein
MARKQRAAVPKVNPFELKRTRAKFDVLGRRVKGAVKNVVQARQDAQNKVRGASVGELTLPCQWSSLWGKAHHDMICNCMHAAAGADPLPAGSVLLPQRKSTLLVEYKQLRKANTFADKRLGGASTRTCSCCEP